MLSIEKCRLLLGTDYPLSDQDISSLRERLYALADITVTVYEELKPSDNGIERPTNGTAPFVAGKAGKPEAIHEKQHEKVLWRKQNPMQESF